MLNRDHLPLPLPEKRHCCQAPTQEFKVRKTENKGITKAKHILDSQGRKIHVSKNN
jgi:hypothetical protein